MIPTKKSGYWVVTGNKSHARTCHGFETYASGPVHGFGVKKFQPKKSKPFLVCDTNRFPQMKPRQGFCDLGLHPTLKGFYSA